VAIARGADKADLAKKLGARVYIDSTTQDPAEELNRLGGAKVILATVTSGKAMTSVLGGLAQSGKLVVLGAADTPLEVPAVNLISGRTSLMGWPSGSSIDSQDTMAFSALTGVRPMTQAFPLERATEAYERMLSGKARFRAVITTGL
jgi:D-arabinose 1-dehydrogenase-like Zn-dependent alcohol dehydrogenase